MAAASQVSQVTHKYPLSNFPIARKLTDNQVDEINKIALEAIGSNAEISRMAREFNAKPYDSEFWDHKNYKLWPIFALKAHTQGLLDRFQTATIIFQYAVVSQFIEETQTYSIQQNGPVAGVDDVYIFSEPCRKPVKHLPKWIHSSDPRFTEILAKLIEAKTKEGFTRYPLQTAENLANVKKYIIESLVSDPKSEQFLFMMDGQDNIKDSSELLDIFNTGSLPFNGCIEIGEESHFVIPSFSILQSFFNYLRPDFPVTLNPVIGKISPNDIIKSRQDNKREVGLPFPIASLDSDYFLKADGYHAGKVAFIMHDAIFHAFKISALSTSENKALIHIGRNLLQPYILKESKKFDEQLLDFFRENNIGLDQRKQIQDALKFSNKNLDLIIFDLYFKLQEMSSPFEVQHLLNIPDRILDGIEAKAISKLKSLKDQMFKIRIAKRFNWLIHDGDLWDSLAEEQGFFTPLFKENDLIPLFILNPDIAKLIIDDIKQNFEEWRQGFGITEDILEEIEDIVEDFED